MSLDTRLRLCGYILALLGLWAVTLTEYFSPLWLIGGTAIVVIAWFYEGSRTYRDAAKRIWLALAVCMLLFFPFDVALFGNLLIPAVHLSMFAQAYSLLNPKGMKAYRRMLLVSFVQLLAATNLTSGMAFAVILTAYCITAVYCVALMYLQRGMQTFGKSANGADGEQRAPAGLLASSAFWSIVLVPVSLALFYSAPRMHYALIARGNPTEVLNQMNRAGQRAGFTKTIELGTFGRIQQDQTLVLRVDVSGGPAALKGPVRWRGGALNIYDGVAWGSSRDYFPYYNGKRWDTGGRNFGMIFPRGNDLYILDEDFANYEDVAQFDAVPNLVKQVFYVEIPYSDTVFGTGKLKAIHGPFRFGIGQDFNQSLTMNNRQALPELISYTVYAAVEQPDGSKLREISYEEMQELIEDESYGYYTATHYLQLPTSLNPRVRELAQEVARRAETPYDKVASLQKFLETEFTYSLDLARPMTDDPLYDFLFISRSGHCEYFATAMTIMTRCIGIPSRLARGFQQGDWNEDGGFFEVRQRDAHAWVEVYFPGYGWVPFDPSPRGEADQYFDSRQSPVMKALTRRLLTLQILWRRHVVGYNETARLRLFGEIRDLVFRRVPQGIMRLPGMILHVVLSLSPGQWVLLALPVALAVGIIAALRRARADILFALPWPRKRLGRVHHHIIFYGHMLRLLEKVKIRKPAHMTPHEFLEVPAVSNHPMFDDIRQLTALYYRVRFGNTSLAAAEATAIKDGLRRLRQSTPGILRSHFFKLHQTE